MIGLTLSPYAMRVMIQSLSTIVPLDGIGNCCDAIVYTIYIAPLVMSCVNVIGAWIMGDSGDRG